MQELKELIKRQAQLNADTNKVVHALRRAQRWRLLGSLLWWGIIFAASAYTYWVYVQPYVEQVAHAYGSAQDLQQQVSGFFGQYFGTSTRP